MMHQNANNLSEVRSEASKQDDANDAGGRTQSHIFGLRKAAYSVKETLELISIGRTTLYELIGQGLLRPIKIGRKTLIGSDDLAALLTKLRRGAR